MTRTDRRLTFGAVLLILIACAALLGAQGPPTAAQDEAAIAAARDRAAVELFEQRVAQYALLHRLLEGPLPPLPVTTNIEQVRALQRELARRIRLARPDAAAGDIINSEVAVMMRRRIATCLSPQEWERIIASHAYEGPATPAPLRVNAPWPEGQPFNFVPPQLLAALPKLPPELHYAIIGRSLVLWDQHANLIVDFLPRAITT